MMIIREMITLLSHFQLQRESGIWTENMNNARIVELWKLCNSILETRIFSIYAKNGYAQD